MSTSAPVELFKPERLLAFSDGVFGVAITLLVIDLRLPPVSVTGEGDAALLQALQDMGPRLAIFAFTFIIVGMGWLGHHRKFSYIARVDVKLLWLNLLYLMALCLVPFASSVLSQHRSRIAFILYTAVMTLVTLLSAGVSAYGLRHPLLGGQQLRPRVRRNMVASPLLTGTTFVLAAGLALGNLMWPAHLILLAIAPIMTVFGAGSRRPG
jgi:uncharacterized membrane protein